jgi:adenine-specific DNA-methyltransferase
MPKKNSRRFLKPKEALNKAFLKVNPVRSEIELFKDCLSKLLDRINESESEEFHKNLVSDFLKKTGFEPAYFINTKGRNDLVIHNGKKAKDPVGVILEAKKPTNKVEMVTVKDLNAKAMQELLLYYLRERISGNNLELKHLVITNIYEWYIFDAGAFEKTFAEDKGLVKQFRDFEAGRLSGSKTDFFYKEIAAPAIEKHKNDIPFTCFDIRDYEKPLRNADKADDVQLIALFKLLSPEHLLKLPFTNDSNSLDKQFYAELLHIIGLTEVKDKGKKLIDRKKASERNSGSLLENTIIQLESLGSIHRLPNKRQYGESEGEQLFAVGLELVITWINRILFLKLLEGQLISYHKGDENFAFLNNNRIREYDDLNALFFQVLAVKPNDRNPDVRKSFERVPYLNSSLFEPTELEHATLFISNLRDNKALPILSSTVLKDDTGKRRSGEYNAIEYLFDFLDAYDFAGEGGEEIQEDNKTLINASVLGLIFEKINGYKDGSFFTPGFITMYMCRETIRRAVVQKFNERKGWHCKSLDELYDHIPIEDRKEANEIINSLRICDPAVGSGHFLVSALNEIIAVKHDLRVLQDREGRRLKEYQIEVVNDELIITDEEGDFFEYNPNSAESRRIQETLFHEKQTLIENCLFGVDINPNSVKICRLRLWIELLKNAYYKADGELETLPNIDINIKCGNSLISRFALDADLSKALKKSKWTIQGYRIAVASYRNAQSKEEKREMEQLIRDIKSDFRSEISKNDPKLKRLYKLNGELFNLLNQQSMFEQSDKEAKAREKKKEKLEKEIEKLTAQIEEIKHNKIYENAFEWRFEFPEVLDEEGDFTGFDVVIGNPPYIRQEAFKELKPYLQQNFETYTGTADLFVYFIELGLNKLRENGEFVFIVPNKWMRAGYGGPLREFIRRYRINNILDFGDLPVFEEATTYPCILSIAKSEPHPAFQAANIDTLNFPEGLDAWLADRRMDVLADELQASGWTLTDARAQRLLAKVREKGVPLGEYVDGKIFRGVLTGLNEAFVIDEATKDRLIAEDAKSAELIKPFLAGRDIKRYEVPKSGKYLILLKNGDTKSWFGDLNEEKAWAKLKGKYPAITDHLLPYERKAKKRYDQGQYWWELRACDYYEEFEKEKIIIPAIVQQASYCLDDQACFSNDKTSIIPVDDKYLLGLLNSHTVDFVLKNISSTKRGGYYEYKPMYVSALPILKDSDSEKKNKISQLVTQILTQKQTSPSTDTSALEAQIDQLVYELYGLTEEEIAIVEGAVK